MRTGHPTRSVSTPRTAALAYRPDIDGLRALAVLAVVVFHAFPSLLRGGFVGVDVFFVISGYLITRTIVHEHDAGDFSLARFYARRARRIFPALVLVLLFTVGGGMLLLPAHEVERLGRHVAAGSLFSSNFLLWHEAGYFDAASAGKPLLHLWSLGIEEQFYLVWPAVLIAFPRWTRFRLRAVALLAVASFALNVLTVGHDATAAFYSPATRAWELMIGALAGLASLRPHRVALARAWREGAAAAGVALILAAMVLLRAELLFPGWYAALPAVGAALLIAAGPRAWINRRVLSHPAAVAIGLVSYPLYLWHWPMLVLARRVTGTGLATQELSPAVALTMVVASLAAARLTYSLLERPLKRPALPLVAWRAAYALAAMALLGGTMAISRADFDADALTAERARNDWATPKSPDAVYYLSRRHDEPRIVFLGDSHAEQYYPAVRAALPDSLARAVAFSTHGGCPFLPTYLPASCGSAYARSMRLAAGPSVRRVIIASAWDMYSFDGHQGEAFQPSAGDLARVLPLLERDVRHLRALGKEVVLIGPHPHDGLADPELLAAHTRVGRFGLQAPSHFAPSFPLADFRRRTAAADTLLSRIAQATGAVVIDPAAVLCPGGSCLTMDEHRVPLRKDSNHLRPFAAIRYLTYVPALLTPRPLAEGQTVIGQRSSLSGQRSAVSFVARGVRHAGADR